VKAELLQPLGYQFLGETVQRGNAGCGWKNLPGNAQLFDKVGRRIS